MSEAVAAPASVSSRIEPHVWRVASVVVLGSIMSILDTTIVNVALRTLGRDLHATLADIQWVLTGYMLALGAAIPVTGWAARRFGARNVYILSLALFTASSILCGLATSTTELILFRVLQGVGGGMILPVGQMMMANAAGPQRMGRIMGITMIPVMLAPIIGPTLGGLIVDSASWRWIFFVNVPIGAIALIASLKILPRDRHGAKERLDVVGLFLLALGVPLVTYGLAEIGATGQFTNPRVVWPIIGGAVLVALFVFHALRVERPLLDLRLYRRPTFSSASVTMFCLAASLFGGMILIPLYWQEVRAESALHTGLLMAPMGIGMVLVLPLRRPACRPPRRRARRPRRRDRDDARDDPVRLDRRAHTGCLAPRHDGRPGHGRRARLHARDDRSVRLAPPFRALGRDPPDERAPASRRLDRHGGPRGRPPALARRQHQPGRCRSGVRHRLLVVGRHHSRRDHPVHRPRPRRASRPLGRDDGTRPSR